MTAQTLNNKIQKGFTLIELLVVIGILAVLLAITLIAINPARQFGNANNTARRSHVTQVLNAVGQYVAENKGQLPPEVSALSATTPATYTRLNSTNFPNLCGQLIPTFIPALPTNPTLNTSDISSCTGTWDTGYSISKDSNNRITVSANQADNAAGTDNSASITVTR